MYKDPSRFSDIDIVRRVIEGDVNAFESLFKRYQGHVMKIVRKRVPPYDVEEAGQEVFVRAYQSLSGFKAKQDFEHWLSKVAVRTCYDYWRKAYRSREVPLSSLTERHREWLEGVLADQSMDSSDQKGVQHEAGELLDWALGKLCAEDRMVVQLVYLEGLSGKEAADLLGWSVANVKVRSFRSRKKLQGLLKGLRKG